MNNFTFIFDNLKTWTNSSKITNDKIPDKMQYITGKVAKVLRTLDL